MTRYRSSSKYGAKKAEVDGIKFDSQGEAKRYKYLKELEVFGIIEDLQIQKKYQLIPAQYEEGTITKTGKLKKGKIIERECAYIADFEYTHKGQRVTEDFKGMRTDAYRIKRKLMLWRHNIRIYETRKWNDQPGGGANV